MLQIFYKTLNQILHFRMTYVAATVINPVTITPKLKVLSNPNGY